MSSNGEDIIRETLQKLGDATGVRIDISDDTIANLGAVLQAQIDLLTELQSAGDCKNNGVTLKGDTPL